MFKKRAEFRGVIKSLGMKSEEMLEEGLCLEAKEYLIGVFVKDGTSSGAAETIEVSKDEEVLLDWERQVLFQVQVGRGDELLGAKWTVVIGRVHFVVAVVVKLIEGLVKLGLEGGLDH